MVASTRWASIRITIGTILGGVLGFYVMHRVEINYKVPPPPPPPRLCALREDEGEAGQVRARDGEKGTTAAARRGLIRFVILDPAPSSFSCLLEFGTSILDSASYMKNNFLP
ncbi:hypothetical protein MUK42_15412 [Musa troglodytarum]|uniref:Uncharacterized protein n=1 Tax=Musa troglodytarum TaxID=320322 RepID=A0A9E7ID71_9LILI|nr:hypothetical protein MUK42_15412 [Musa troglodytarum]